MSRLSLPARSLRVGDYLLGSRRTVTHAPSAGVGTPSGKVELGVDGYKAVWNARTVIQVERAEVGQ